MSRRTDLQQILENCLGSEYVYFQPPENLKIQGYPAIIYSTDDIYKKSANNKPYLKYRQYQVTVISKNPDDNILEKISDLPLCDYSRHFAQNNLYHDIFNIYY